MPRGENFKGRKLPNSGAKKGSKNAKTLAWEQLGEFITEKGAERVSLILQSCEPGDFFKYYCILLEYFKPKLQRSEVNQTVKSFGVDDIIKQLKE